LEKLFNLSLPFENLGLGNLLILTSTSNFKDSMITVNDISVQFGGTTLF
jgi:hypothetical protein